VCIDYKVVPGNVQQAISELRFFVERRVAKALAPVRSVFQRTWRLNDDHDHKSYKPSAWAGE
jgi:hypothetical protein